MEELLINIEGPILLWIQEYLRVDFLTPIITFITHLGDSGWIWIACALLFLILPKTRKTGAVMAVSMIFNLFATNIVLKNLLARTRPYEAVEGLHRIIEAQSDFSFPSGHTACSFAAAVVIFLMCPRKAGVPAMVFAVLISLSRLYVGVHFPTDVIGGAIVGTAAALLAWWIYKKFEERKSIPAECE